MFQHPLFKSDDIHRHFHKTAWSAYLFIGFIRRINHFFVVALVLVAVVEVAAMAANSGIKVSMSPSVFRP